MTSPHKMSVHLGPLRSYWEIVGFQLPVLNGALLVGSLRFSEDPKNHKSYFLFLLYIFFFSHHFFPRLPYFFHHTPGLWPWEKGL